MEVAFTKHKLVMDNALMEVLFVETVRDVSHQLTDHSKNVMENAFRF